MNPGVYEAKIVNYGLVRTQKGDLQAAVKFGFEVDGKKQSMTWYGGFSSKATKYTLQALINCGLNTAADELANGLSSNALDTINPVFLDIGPEEYQGRTKIKIKRISKYALGSKPVDRDAAKEAFAITGVDAELKSLLAAANGEPMPDTSSDFGGDISF